MTEAAAIAWATVAELAALRGVSSSAISQRVTRLEAQGALSTRSGPGRSKLVPVAEFLRAIDATADPVREQNGSGRPALLAAAPPSGEAPPRAAGDLVYSQEQARNTAIRADLAQLELDERLGKLLPVEDVQAAWRTVFETMLRAIGQISSAADELASAVAKDGVSGLRLALREQERLLRERIVDEMRTLSGGVGGQNDPGV